jgi:hypothetical protein
MLNITALALAPLGVLAKRKFLRSMTKWLYRTFRAVIGDFRATVEVVFSAYVRGERKPHHI